MSLANPEIHAAPRARRRGFTLIEFSIVLVVIALLAGGIIAGKEMIASAQIRNIASQYQEYKAATLTFKLKYNCIPGDCAKAAQLGLGPSGNGDGIVYNSYVGSQYLEPYRFWQHLGQSGLIKGTYNGTWSWADGLFYQVNGNNGPLVRGDEAALGFWAGTSDYDAGGPADLVMLPPTLRGPSLNIMVSRFSSKWTQTRAFPAWKAKAIDDKLDDGLPFTGVAYHSANWNCINPGWPTNEYNADWSPSTNMCTVKFVILQ